MKYKINKCFAIIITGDSAVAVTEKHSSHSKKCHAIQDCRKFPGTRTFSWLLFMSHRTDPAIAKIMQFNVVFMGIPPQVVPINSVPYKCECDMRTHKQRDPMLLAVAHMSVVLLLSFIAYKWF